MSDEPMLGKIASNVLKKVPSGEKVEVQSLWKDSTTVFYFMRRFGCPVCQYISRQINKIKPMLDENGVKLVGIGPEELGSKEFFEAKHFDGDIFYDEEKKCYQDLEYKRYNVFNVLGAALNSKSRELASLASKEGIKGNFQGDLMQTGGLLVVQKGGEKILMNFKQQNPGDTVENQKILDTLGIIGTAEKNDEQAPSCTL